MALRHGLGGCRHLQSQHAARARRAQRAVAGHHAAGADHSAIHQHHDEIHDEIHSKEDYHSHQASIDCSEADNDDASEKETSTCVPQSQIT